MWMIVWLACCFTGMFVWICTMCMPGASGDQKRALDPLGLELQMVMSHPVGAGN